MALWPWGVLATMALALAGALVLAAVLHRRLARMTRPAEHGVGRDLVAKVFDTAGLLVVVLDRDGAITMFNRQCEALTGYEAEEVVGRPVWTVLLRPDQAETVYRTFNQVAGGQEHPVTLENDWITATGERRQVLWTHTGLTDDTGAVTHVIATGIDVSDQRHTEKLFADVLDAAAEQAIMATNPAGTVVLFNAGAERLLGYRPDAVIGLATLDKFHVRAELAARAEDLGVPAGAEVLFAPARDGSTQPREWTYVRGDGRKVPVSLAVSAMRDDLGEVTGYLGVARDVSRERDTVDAMLAALERETLAADRLRELDRVRSDLVATVSHELRTPLTSILGNLELLVDGDAGPVPAAQARLLSAIERNARRLLALIEDLLIMSRIESGAIKINASAVPLKAVVAGALEALASVRSAHRVDLDVKLPDEPVLVYGDRGQLERIVINLVDNALKFTPDGGAARVTVDPGETDVCLTITDTGIGIPDDEIEQVFDRFFRSSRSHERQTQGSGLGLAITKSIVERHGGRIAVCRRDPAGTVVTCHLPRA